MLRSSPLVAKPSKVAKLYPCRDTLLNPHEPPMPVSSGIFELLVRRSQTSLAFSEGNPTCTGPERTKTEKKTGLPHWMLLLLYVQVLGLMKDCVYAGMPWGTASSWKICLSNLAQILHPASGERALPKPQHPGVLESGSNGFTKQHRLNGGPGGMFRQSALVSNIQQTLGTTWASGINVLQQMTFYATTMLEFSVPGRQSCSSSDPAVLHIYVFARDVFFV